MHGKTRRILLHSTGVCYKKEYAINDMIRDIKKATLAIIRNIIRGKSILEWKIGDAKEMASQ